MKNLTDLSRSLRKRPSRPEAADGRELSRDSAADGSSAAAIFEENPAVADAEPPLETADPGAGNAGDEGSAVVEGEKPRRSTTVGATAAAAAKPHLIGYIDRVDDKHIHGWACNTREPNSSVTILVILPDGKENLVFANMFRDDVKAAGHGNGNHGFQISYSGLKKPEGQVRVLFYETRELLVGGLLMLDPRKALLENTMPPDYELTMRRLAEQARATYAGLNSPDS